MKIILLFGALCLTAFNAFGADVALTAEGSGYFVVSCDGEFVSQHTAEREAAESLLNQRSKGGELCNYTHPYKVTAAYAGKALEFGQIDFTAQGSGYFVVRCGENQVSQHTAEREAAESLSNALLHGGIDCAYTHEYRVVGEYEPLSVTPVVGGVDCPDDPTATNGGRYEWFLCSIRSTPSLSAYGIDYPMSYMTPKPENFDGARLRLYLHPSQKTATYVNGTSSFDHANSQGQVELHIQEDNYKPPGSDITYGGESWWVFSGNQVGDVQNFNGNRISASLDYLLDRYDGIDLERGITCVGVSLGGAGCYHQAMVLPKYQDKISIVVGYWGRIIIPAYPGGVAQGWGDDHWDDVDIRLPENTEKVKNIHFFWAGGANDSFDRFDTAFLDNCEANKISCSWVWLQSGHSFTEPGYTVSKDLWTDQFQDAVLNQILPVITNNTSNYRGDLRGYHNRGVTWNSGGIVDTPELVEIPLQYIAMRDLGPDLPDQPETVSFSVSLRRVVNMPIAPGETVVWSMGTQNGRAVADSDGLVTIDGLTLEDNAGYSVLRVTKDDVVVVVPPDQCHDPMVYTRVPRTLTEYTGKYTDGTPYTVGNMDYMDGLPEVSNVTSNFNAPGQLVALRCGVIEIIHDCMDDVCVPNDPSVSLDGKSVIYSLMRSSKFKPPWPENKNLPNQLLSSVGNEAQIIVHDFETGVKTEWSHTPGTKDTGPIFLPDGKVMFTSTREKQYGPSLNNIGSKDPLPQLWKANADGTDAYNIGQHEVAGALHPKLLDSGDVIYSSHWMSHNLAYGSTNGSINWPGTTDNFYAVMKIDRDGGDQVAMLGAHKANMVGVNPKSYTMKAFHFLGQRWNGHICAENYYRANNLGLGDVVCFPMPPKGIEGPTPNFVPSGIYSAALWSTSEDTGSGKKDGKYLGKVGYPRGTPDNQLLLTVGRGLCTKVASGIPGTSIKIGDDKGCDVGIYKTTVIPSESPDDLIKIVDDPEWHEYGQVLIAARNVPMPPLSKTGDGSCQLISTNAGATDALNYKGYSFNNNYKVLANNGALIDGMPHSDLAAIRFYQVLPNKTKSAPFKNSIGNELMFMGDVPLLADNSFRAKLPCNVPYVMAGVNKDGRVFKRDQVPQSLRPGEQRVCKGCHLHATAGRELENSLANTAPPYEVKLSVPVPTFTEDILPIFEAKCTGCHTDDVPVTDYDKLVWDYTQKYVPDAMKVQMKNSTNVNHKYGIHRPYTSRNVNNMYALESRLYWKAANKRTDNRTDDTYANDFDFGADHPTDITVDELRLIGDWLDSGATK